MKAIYIASPYTVGDTAINVRVQMQAADNLMDHGYCPIVPLFSHFQHMHKPRPYQDWLAIDFEKIKRCDALLRLPGDSSGADSEVELAKAIGIPVYFSFEDLFASGLGGSYFGEEKGMGHE